MLLLLFSSLQTRATLINSVEYPFGHNLGPLHTRAKSRNREIVRAQKKVSKGHLKTPPKSCSVATEPQV
jgi:hypothetical protein